MQVLNDTKYISVFHFVLLKYWDKEIGIYSLTLFENKNFPLYYPLFIWIRKKCEDIKFSLAGVTFVSIFVYVLPVFFILFF